MAALPIFACLVTAAFMIFGAIRDHRLGDRIIYGVAGAGFSVAAGLMAAGGVR